MKRVVLTLDDAEYEEFDNYAKKKGFEEAKILVHFATRQYLTRNPIKRKRDVQHQLMEGFTVRSQQ